MSDKVAAAREWLETPSAMPYYEDVERELVIAVQHIRNLLAEIDRLRGAIETHRRNIWGEGPVEHDEDIQLYAALRRGGSNANTDES